MVYDAVSVEGEFADADEVADTGVVAVGAPAPLPGEEAITAWVA